MAASIALAVNFVKLHQEIFGIKPTQKVHFSPDCTKCIRVSKIRTQEIQLFSYDFGAATVYLPRNVLKADMKTAINKSKNVKLEDAITDDSWCWMRVTSNRLAVLDQILKNSYPQEAQENKELEEAKEKIKQLEAELATYKKEEPRVLTSYMTLGDDHVVHIDTNNPLGKLIYHYKLTANWHYDIDEAIDSCEKIALGLNTLCAELKRAKANGATHITY